ncbi:MAG TPA: tlde1 domain-containing protein [Candidatus Sulfotelmatobacter sp.]|nr:tlde1 domain-containing protein [Candidatus Sulfotelmatobacter sp.]
MFETTSGYMYSPTGHKMEPPGYSGHAEGVNNPAMESIHNVGPLPSGIYDLDAPLDHSQLGPFAIPLIPHAENEMYGRNGFYIHGDEVAHAGEELASHGCIIQIRAIRQAMWLSLDHVLAVVANYSDFAQPNA